YEERLAYINYLQREGMSFSGLHEYAQMQLHIVDMLDLNGTVTREEISGIVTTKQGAAKEAGGSLSPKWSSTFRAVATGWLKYAGMLDEKRKDLPRDANLVKKYVQWAIEAKGLAHATLEGRERELSCFLSFIQNGLSFKEIKLDTIDSYIRYRHGCGCNRRSIATIATTLRDFLGYAYNQGWCSNIAGGIRHPKVFYLETLPYAPSWDTVQELVAHYGTSDAKGKRNTAIIAMMAIYGLRSSEVVNLRLKDMDWDKNQIYLKRAKRGGLQAFPLLPETGNLIADYIRHGRKNTLGREELFLTLFAPYKKLTGSCIYYIVSQSYSKTETGVRHKGGHSLRHACASHIINNGGTLKDVSDLLGHRLLDTTRTYAKVDLVNLRKVADLKWEGVL
ncbi:MAG: tyrosine-type recombinase/integrase, partial [Proteiniphilum sp.]|nr:tyrosine-type recombinase/integrase [Proteiniphilum sp.]MDD3077410.1 tyrosine-type recombinase/integrase [Proteiniphilum sp.]MDD3780599.1 tyrosine-type recombinase/integrase [Proteiniphilum sp.]